MNLQTIHTKTLPVLIGSLVLLLSTPARADEANGWPFWIHHADDSGATDWTAAGPLVFADTPTAGEAAFGLRPLWVEKTSARNGTREAYFLYPLFSYRASAYGYHWSLLSLINHYEDNAAEPVRSGEAAAPPPGGFDLWPFYFSRQTGNPDTSYRAVMPLYGTVLNRFGLDRLSWTLFPVYARAEKRHVATTAVLWPLFRSIHGEGNHGFTFWPLFGFRAKDGAYREQFYLWPLIYKDEHALWRQDPSTRTGFLPFYAGEHAPGLTSETFAGPFFGYTDRTRPYRYHEVRYFWPFLVQGRGDGILVNRWAPIYTHSIRKGIDKTWILWPLWRHQVWTESGLLQTRNQVLWFFYNSTVQRSATRPQLPPARKTHLWPLISYWDNGAGRRQVQVLSPFASLFPYNEPIQLAYDPLFALFRFDQRSPGDRRTTFLWNLVSWHRQGGQKEFHFGPLLGVDTGTKANRITIGCGLLGLKKQSPEDTWHPFFFEFKTSPASAATQHP